jgi:hypothetical protein
MSNITKDTPKTGRAASGISVLLTIAAFALAVSACDSVTNSVDGGTFGIPALSASRLGVGDPTPISSEAELALIGNDPDYPLDGDYLLVADLDLTNWVPIGYPVTPFTGSFDGGGHAITITSFDTDVLTDGFLLGIFGIIGDGSATPSVSNLTVNIAADPLAVETAPLVGALSGGAERTSFSDIAITGAFTVISSVDSFYNGFYVGGLVGYVISSQLSGIDVSASLNFRYASPDSNVVNAGGVTGYAEESTFNDISLTGSLTAIHSVAGPAIEWRIVKTPESFRAFSDSAPGADGINIGGVTGGATDSKIFTVRSSALVNTASINTPVYAGGVAGYGNNVTINDSVNSGSVTGIGPGYNTSAGGIAGYITASTVTNSSASGNIDLTAQSVEFGWDDSWQIYAGGLIGYEGGSSTTPSYVGYSHATGNVSAVAPFPYAGGLIGYLYGYSDYYDPPSRNGSTLAKSYATGNVISKAQLDPNGVYGDIPYAGGLVGYSSVVGSQITDSYARGNATATTTGTYAWAGGLIGGNANNSVVTRIYATGDVYVNAGPLPPLYAPDYADAGPAGGGIAGFNYYSTSTSVSYSVALNKLVQGNQSTTQDVLHRVVGSLGNTAAYTGVLNNNLANANMKVADNWQFDFGPNNRDGADTATQPPQKIYTDLGWNFSTVWTMGSDNYPVLR